MTCACTDCTGCPNPPVHNGLCGCCLAHCPDRHPDHPWNQTAPDDEVVRIARDVTERRPGLMARLAEEESRESKNA